MDDGEQCSRLTEVSEPAAFCDVMNSALEGRSAADQYKDILSDPLHLFH